MRNVSTSKVPVMIGASRLARIMRTATALPEQ